MFALATQDVDSTAKSIADTLKAAQLNTDDEKAAVIAESVRTMPNLKTYDDKTQVIKQTSVFGVSEAVINLALDKLGKPTVPKTKGYPWWVWGAIAIAVVVVVGGGYLIWQRRKRATGRI